MTAIPRATLDAMLAMGGGFERALARCAIEADSWIGYAAHLVAAYHAADRANKAMVAEAFPDLWALEGTSEADRVGFLVDLFGPTFDKFAARGALA